MTEPAPAPAPAPAPKKRLVHAGTTGGKWSLGKTLCKKPASWRTPMSARLDEVTCPCCRRRLAEKMREAAAP